MTKSTLLRESLLSVSQYTPWVTKALSCVLSSLRQDILRQIPRGLLKGEKTISFLDTQALENVLSRACRTLTHPELMFRFSGEYYNRELFTNAFMGSMYGDDLLEVEGAREYPTQWIFPSLEQWLHHQKVHLSNIFFHELTHREQRYRYRQAGMEGERGRKSLARKSPTFDQAYAGQPEELMANANGWAYKYTLIHTTKSPLLFKQYHQEFQVYVSLLQKYSPAYKVFVRHWVMAMQHHGIPLDIIRRLLQP